MEIVVERDRSGEYSLRFIYEEHSGIPGNELRIDGFDKHDLNKLADALPKLRVSDKDNK